MNAKSRFNSRASWTIILGIVMSACQSTAPQSPTTAPRLMVDGSHGFAPAYIGGPRPAPALVAKLAHLKGLVTLGDLVGAIGPGWIDPGSGIGYIEWELDDGRTLRVLPLAYEPENVLREDLRAFIPGQTVPE